MAKPRLLLLAGCAAVITASAGAWVYQVRQRPASEPPARLGPWSLGDAFEAPKPPPPSHPIDASAPKRTGGATRIVAALTPEREGSLAPEPGTGTPATASVESPIAALGNRVEMSPRPTNLPVVVPHADQTGLSKVFAVQQRRSDSYVPGNLHGWIGYDISFDKPMLLRAGGELRAGTDAAGPGGLTVSDYEKGLAVRRADFPFRGNARVMNTAPYLALIGRICSNEICSAPFLVGSGTVLCPSPISVKGELQLWTNNYVRLEGFQTLLPYSRVSGGYRFQTEPAPAGVCGPESNVGGAAAPRPDIAALDAGQVLRESSFIVSSRQMSWKPFFLPLDRALVIRSSGYMQPREAGTRHRSERHRRPGRTPVELPWLEFGRGRRRSCAIRSAAALSGAHRPALQRDHLQRCLPGWHRTNDLSDGARRTSRALGQPHRPAHRRAAVQPRRARVSIQTRRVPVRSVEGGRGSVREIKTSGFFFDAVFSKKKPEVLDAAPATGLTPLLI